MRACPATLNSDCHLTVTIREPVIQHARNHAFSATDGGILPTTYNPSDGTLSGGAASVPNTTITFPSPISTSLTVPTSGVAHTKSVNVGAIVGGVLGGVCVLGLVTTSILIWKRNSRKSHQFAVEPFTYNPAPPASISQHRSDTNEGPSPLVSSNPPPTARTLEPRLPTSIIPASSQQRSARFSRSRSRPSRGSNSTAGLSSTYVRELRVEVENLRRAMQEIQADRMMSPPEYTSARNSLR
ncbi:hypothetical protein OBBRIDRAFT_604963 [Obba rivulosa]|uniref:Uncharacterized protein n=1 Tax=Obba rivulosa TaxID=1052685 RepID=A0A8E2ASS8_9APHY|nr:hypothetical protein OBBRIDRAFT_604963 [Obba rivulosa]